MKSSDSMIDDELEITVFDSIDSEELVDVFEESIEEIIDMEAEDGGGLATTNYNDLSNKPKINDVILENNKTSNELGLQEKMEAMSNLDIENLLNSQM